MKPKWVALNTAAMTIAEPPAKVFALCTRGTLKARKAKEGWEVETTSIARYLRARKRAAQKATRERRTTNG